MVVIYSHHKREWHHHQQQGKQPNVNNNKLLGTLWDIAGPTKLLDTWQSKQGVVSMTMSLPVQC